LHQLANKVPF